VNTQQRHVTQNLATMYDKLNAREMRNIRKAIFTKIVTQQCGGCIRLISFGFAFIALINEPLGPGM
jgi:hypothetical protein